MIKVRYGTAPLVPVLVNLHVICHVEGTELLRGVFDLSSSRGPSGPHRTPVHLLKTYPSESRATYAPRRDGKIQFYYLHA